ncbi:MAG: transketolase C-terminal domain-containing protein [Flavonifractor plautii]
MTWALPRAMRWPWQRAWPSRGCVPVFAVYSSFLQRSYDMLLHDVALQQLHVVLAVDRAGLVGEDGETHHGVFDPAFLDTIPGMTVLCPSSFQELREMLRYAIYDVEGPVAVRYSRGGEGAYQGSAPVEPATLLRTGADITLAGYGMMLNQLLDCADRLARNGIQAEVVKLNTITPIPLERLTASVQKTGRLLVAEDSAAGGRCGAAHRRRRCLTLASQVRGLALVNTGHTFVTHGTVPQLQRLCGLDGASLYHRALEVCRHG